MTGMLPAFLRDDDFVVGETRTNERQRRLLAFLVLAFQGGVLYDVRECTVTRAVVRSLRGLVKKTSLSPTHVFCFALLMARAREFLTIDKVTGAFVEDAPSDGVDDADILAAVRRALRRVEAALEANAASLQRRGRRGAKPARRDFGVCDARVHSGTVALRDLLDGLHGVPLAHLKDRVVLHIEDLDAAGRALQSFGSFGGPYGSSHVVRCLRTALKVLRAEGARPKDRATMGKVLDVVPREKLGPGVSTTTALPGMSDSPEPLEPKAAELGLHVGETGSAAKCRELLLETSKKLLPPPVQADARCLWYRFDDGDFAALLCTGLAANVVQPLAAPLEEQHVLLRLAAALERDGPKRSLAWRARAFPRDKKPDEDCLTYEGRSNGYCVGVAEALRYFLGSSAA